jgi:ESF2/ABP1 family protein
MSDDEEERSVDRLHREAALYREEFQRRGVIYMSRVPPFMKPNKVKSIFEQYGEVTRVYLAEEDPQARKKRREHGGNGSKQFREGWIEFSDKKIAKKIAESLNNTPIGGKKGDFYHDDIWNLKYLKGFKWEFLTEKLTYERRIRETKLKATLLQARKMNAEMSELIEKTKVQEQVNERKKKRKLNEVDQDEAVNTHNSEEAMQKKMKRKFKQNRMIGAEYDDKGNKVNKSLLKSIFTRAGDTDGN